MQYKHNCDKCVYLGTFNQFDLYYCNQEVLGPTVVARYGNLPHEYLSGLTMTDLPLLEAKKRAKERGLLLQ